MAIDKPDELQKRSCHMSGAVSYVWRLGLLWAGALVAVLALSTASAHADPLPALAPDCPACATDAGGARVIDIYGEMNGTPPVQWYATDTPPPVQGWAAQTSDDLNAVEAASEAGGTTAESIGGGLMGAGADTGFIASASTLVATLGWISLAGVDTALVIHDGTMLFHAFFGSAAPPEDATLVRWLSSDPLWYQWAGPNSDAAEAAAGADVWNAPGWLAQWQWHSQFWTEVPHGNDFPAPSNGTRVDFYDFDSMDGFYWGDHFYYLLARDIPGSVTTYNPATDQPDYTLPTPALADRSTAASALNTELARPEYHTLRLELQHMLDPRCSPDPTSSTVTVPSVLPGETPDDYTQCLSTLGLNAKPTETLPDSEVDWGTPSGDVVDTQPSPGDAVDPGSSVTIYANPATMPTPTQRESDLGTALEAKDASITESNKLDIARECLDLEDQATGNTDFSEDNGDSSFQNCKGLPIFITGHDAKSAGQHDEIALGQNPVTDPTLTITTATGGVNPTWVLLHRYLAGWSRSWLTPAPVGSGCDDPRRSEAIHCDEYPFASVYEGGQANNPNLQLIDGPQNTRQGLMLGGFYGQGTYAGLQGCNVPDNAPFLAIPVPNFVGVNTTWACNGGS